MLAPFWLLPFCFFLLFLACFPPSGLRACRLARFWLSLACVVLSGSLSAVCGSYLLGWAFLAVPCLRCPVWLVSCRLLVCTCWVGCLWLLPACFVLSEGSFPAVCGSYLLGRASLAVTCLRCPVWLVSCRLLFVPAWCGVSSCCLAVCGSYLLGWTSLAVSFPPSLVCTCLLAPENAKPACLAEP